MNNDITGNLGKFMNTQNYRKPTASFEAPVEAETKENQNIRDINSMNFLDTLGHAQVNMDSSKSVNTRQAVQSFVNDPIKSELHNDFCDNLVERGYNLEDAIIATDEVFKTLQKKETYQ